MGTVSITLAGDYFIGDGYSEAERSAIKRFVEDRDFVVFNYEGSLPAPVLRNKAVNLAMAGESLDLPAHCLLSLANNHVLDFGHEGLGKTLHRLKELSLNWFGLESRLGESDNYTIIEKDECRICFAGFGWRNEECVEASGDSAGVVNFTKAKIDRLFDRLKQERYDHLIVYVHYGYEHEHYPLPLHVGLSRYLIDKGASLVYGSHSHSIQSYETYRDRYIFYGVGNFIFTPGHHNYPEDSDRGLIINVSVTPDRVELTGLERIQYSRAGFGFTIRPDVEFLNENQLPVTDLKVYGKLYAQLRSRKRNPRPIMHYRRPVTNAVKYFFWLVLVRATGYLGIRQVVKRMVGWG